MNSKEWPQIRNDDVLQVSSSVTHNQFKEIRGRGSFYKMFVEADKVLEEYDHPTILAVLSEGITGEKPQKEWIKYIRERKHRFQIELHGSYHHNYATMLPTELYADLKEAKKVIEDTFETEIKTWYPPFGRKGENHFGPEICGMLGMKQFEQWGKVDLKLWLKSPKKYPHINYHFWHRGQVETLKEVVCRLHEKH